jgi:hypothetical protein
MESIIKYIITFNSVGWKAGEIIRFEKKIKIGIVERARLSMRKKHAKCEVSMEISRGSDRDGKSR